METKFQRADVAAEFLDRRRKALPFAEEQIAVMLRVIGHYLTPQRVVDLGCGDGILSRAILNAFPEATAVLVDHSAPMLDRARQAMAKFGDRVSVVQSDLTELLPANVSAADVVVSAFAIHHLPGDRKKALYTDIFQRLSPGGLFINLEHVAPPSAKLEALFDQVFIDNLVEATGEPEAKVAAEYHGRPDKADNILEPLELQMSWLREIGYVDVDCYFKFLELAVFGGVKTA
jgi:ubiquinone/menaquinone biosynthesis C-methylase UbiE